MFGSRRLTSDHLGSAHWISYAYINWRLTTTLSGYWEVYSQVQKHSLLQLNCNILILMFEIESIFWVKIMGKSVPRSWYIHIVYFNDNKFKKWDLILKVLGIFFLCTVYSSFHQHFPNSLHQILKYIMAMLLDHRTTASSFHDYHWQEELLNKKQQKTTRRL